MVVSDLYDGRWIRGVWELFLKGYVEEVPCMFVFGLFAVAAEVHREGHGWGNSDGEGNSRVARLWYSCCGNKDSTATQLRITPASHSTSTHDFYASTVMLYYRYHGIEIIRGYLSMHINTLNDQCSSQKWGLEIEVWCLMRIGGVIRNFISNYKWASTISPI